MALPASFLEYIQNLIPEWTKAQNTYRQDQVNQWLSSAVGGAPTSVAAAVNTQHQPIDSSWVFKNPVGSGVEAEAQGMHKFAIDAQNQQNRQNWFEMLLSKMPQFTLPMPDFGGMGEAGGGGPVDRRPMTGSIHGLEGINDWSGNATTTPRPFSSSDMDLYSTGNEADFQRMRGAQGVADTWNDSQAIQPYLRNLAKQKESLREKPGKFSRNSSLFPALPGMTEGVPQPFRSPVKGTKGVTGYKTGKGSYSTTKPTSMKKGGKKK